MCRLHGIFLPICAYLCKIDSRSIQLIPVESVQIQVPWVIKQFQLSSLFCMMPQMWEADSSRLMYSISITFFDAIYIFHVKTANTQHLSTVFINLHEDKYNYIRAPQAVTSINSPGQSLAWSFHEVCLSTIALHIDFRRLMQSLLVWAHITPAFGINQLGGVSLSECTCKYSIAAANMWQVVTSFQNSSHSL